MRKESLFYGLAALLLVTGCSKTSTKEFFFGSPYGPDPFVIGSTLSPLKTIPNFNHVDLPKPKPILSASQMPSHAKKASEILNISTEKKSMVMGASDTTGSIFNHQNHVINFEEFDKSMNNKYANQKANGYVLSSILGQKKSIDPTIREKLKERQED